MDNIILIGMPGVGKSCIGVVLAKALGMSFIDSDIVIQERTGRTLREIIEEGGREAFLRLEDEINASLEAENCVIATGGSVIYGERAMRHFQQIGTVVYLAIRCDHLSERLGDLDERGVIHDEGQTLQDIYDERVGLYEKYAGVTVWEHDALIEFDEVIRDVREALGLGAET
ncbi:MAG: shikimate kinase [Oscillospiraceae bacterium]|nr:shikimate kinase [Oscillospiraceae bacterium]